VAQAIELGLEVIEKRAEELALQKRYCQKLAKICVI
jgi:hypothetical protein